MIMWRVKIMKILTFILTLSFVLNLSTKAAISCNTKACKISNKTSICYKKEVLRQTECCCSKMKCKISTKYNEVPPPVDNMAISIQYEHLPLQNVLPIIDKLTPFGFSATFFYFANPPSKNNSPLLA